MNSRILELPDVAGAAVDSACVTAVEMDSWRKMDVEDAS
jgi:hypothetical protein